MRHRVAKHGFGRRSGPRKALIRGLVDSLVAQGRVRTTLPKAKELRRQVEKAVTVGKKGGTHATRLLLSKYPNQKTVSTLVNDLSVRFKDRPGGYTRIIKAGNRPGDNAEMAFIEFVDYELPEVKDEETVEANPAEEKRKRQLARRREAKKKRLRQIQNQSRRNT